MFIVFIINITVSLLVVFLLNNNIKIMPNKTRFSFKEFHSELW